MFDDVTNGWTTVEASELYQIGGWGKGYFSIGTDGHVHVHPERDPNRSIDMKDLIDRLRLRGLDLPILVRFNRILKDRLREIHDVFHRAINEHGYQGSYCCVYPIKVNQQRQVVEQIIQHGSQYGFGVEAGSKPELLAVAAMTKADTPIICNGFKDAEFIEMAMLAQKLGRRVIPVVEKYTELELILKYAEKVGVRPHIGMRMKLGTRGSGRWQSSGGYRSKFGLTAGELLRGFEELSQRGMADCFKLLHFHLGSQVTNIRHVKAALNEGARVYVDLTKRGAGLEFLDVGGGLGVDYDGSQTDFESSINYTPQEYANDIVYYLMTVCDSEGIKHPNIITESGRAIAAYHSVLVFDVLGVAELGSAKEIPDAIPDDSEQPLHDLLLTYKNTTARNVLESFHDAQQGLETTLNLFSTGYLPLHQRSVAENLFWATCDKIRRLTRQMDFVPEELQNLDSMLSDTYYCNFSLFQSMPDSWAVKQLFPVMPIHRLDERPTRHAVLGDITCDSDGKIDRFVDRRDIQRTLLLQPFDGSPYFLGAFLIGAYQEILGDLHNLFGDTNTVHVDLTDEGEVKLETILRGDTVSEVFDYVNFDERDLIHRLQVAVEVSVHEGRLAHDEAGRFVKFYETALHGYTYLKEPAKE